MPSLRGQVSDNISIRLFCEASRTGKSKGVTKHIPRLSSTLFSIVFTFAFRSMGLPFQIDC